MSKSEEVLHLKLVDTAFEDMFYKNYTNEQVAVKYNCSVHTASKARSSKEYQKKCKLLIEQLDQEVMNKFEKIKANSLLYLDEFAAHVIREKDFSPQNVANIIKILERIEKRFSQKHEIDGNINQEITYIIPNELKKLLEENINSED